jgi:hypothetical protein
MFRMRDEPCKTCPTLQAPPFFAWEKRGLGGVLSLETPLTDEQFRQLFNRLERYLEHRYELPVVLTDVPNPFTGDLNGAEINIDHEVDPAEAVFILIHLFGHTVQWNTDESTRDTQFSQMLRQSDELVPALLAYETLAVQYSLQLLHDLGVHDLDQRVSDYAGCDFRFLLHLYRTGEKREFHSFWEDNQPLLTPVPIPDFVPTQWKARWEGVVF